MMFHSMLGIPCLSPCKLAGHGEVDYPLSDIPAYDRHMQNDDIAARIEAFDTANGYGDGFFKDKGAYHLVLLETEAPIVRLKPTGNGDKVRIGYWSHRCKWEDVDDTGGVAMPLDEALAFIANQSTFWLWT